MLTLVPERRYGRHIASVIILLLGFALFGFAVTNAATTRSADWSFAGWPPAAFFVCAIAYIVPVFHYITFRTQRALDKLRPFIAADEHAAVALLIDHRSLGWTLRIAGIAISLWLGQSLILAGSWAAMWADLSDSLLSFLMAIGPLFVWLTMATSMSVLIRNALLFRRLTSKLDVRILEPDSYMPIGSMAVTSTLVVLGALGLLSIMWLGGPVNWWTTLPGLAIFSPLVVALLVIPVLPLHERLTEQRKQAIDGAQRAIRQAESQEGSVGVANMADALSLRRELTRLPTWPFDVPAILRFFAYAVIVPLTWAGAALIEILVNSIVS